MPYMYPDLNAARDLVNAGGNFAPVMPLASQSVLIKDLQQKNLSRS